MADQKISELTALTGANVADDDAIAIVDTSATETKKIVFSELKNALDTATGFVRITGDTMTGDLTTTGLTVDGTSRFNNYIDFGGSISTPSTAAAIYRPADNQLAFSTANSERMRIDSSGHAIIPAGVTLGTSVGVYAAANTLDDYEEGTWTPVITPEGGSAAGITVNYATYTKVGRLVSLVFDVTINSISGTSSSNAIELTGMPFNSATSHGGGPNIAYGNLTGSMTGTLALNANTTSKYRIVNLDGVSALNASDHLQATSRLEGQFTYHTT